jgi:hypothetical protein
LILLCRDIERNHDDERRRQDERSRHPLDHLNAPLQGTGPFTKRQ